jgi:hypothetical protein
MRSMRILLLVSSFSAVAILLGVADAQSAGVGRPASTPSKQAKRADDFVMSVGVSIRQGRISNRDSSLLKVRLAEIGIRTIRDVPEIAEPRTDTMTGQSEDRPEDIERSEGVAINRLYAESFRSGVSRAFHCEIVAPSVARSGQNRNDDDIAPNCSYGLLSERLDFRPAGVAMRSLLGVLADRGQNTFVPTSLDYDLSGETLGVRDLLLQKKDGTFYLLLWAVKSGASRQGTDMDSVNQQVTLSIPDNFDAATVSTFDTDGNLDSFRVGTVGGNMSLAIPPAVMIVQLKPSAPITPVSAPTTIVRATSPRTRYGFT